MPPRDYYRKFPALLRRRRLWLIGVLLVVSAGAAGITGRLESQGQLCDAPVERGDVESTVVAAGILQPIKYVDVGAQTSGKLKSLKVKRGDHVEENQSLAEIDPVRRTQRSRRPTQSLKI